MSAPTKKFRKYRVASLFAASALVTMGLDAALADPNSGQLPRAGSTRPATPRIDPAKSYQEGVEALREGNYRTAEKKFGEVLSVARDHPEANYYMGLAKIGRGKEKASIRYFRRAIKERPGFVEAHEELALVYVGLGETEDAVEQLEALNEIKENCTVESCGQIVIDRTDQAIATVEAALAGAEGEAVGAAPELSLRFAMLSPDGPEAGIARYDAAARLINQERYREAIAALYDAQASYGPHPDILNYLGYSHRKADDFVAAKDYYAQALALDPEHRGAIEYLGELYLELGDIKKAKKQLAKLDRVCVFACPEREDLARLIAAKQAVRSARR